MRAKDIQADTLTTLTQLPSSQSTIMTIRKRKLTKFPCDRAQQRATQTWKSFTPTLKIFTGKCWTNHVWEIGTTMTQSLKFVSSKKASCGLNELSFINVEFLTLALQRLISHYAWWIILNLLIKDTRRQPRKDKTNRNQSQSLDTNNDDLNVSNIMRNFLIVKPLIWRLEIL